MNTLRLFTSAFTGISMFTLYAQPTQRPNIVLIMCDDMGFSDLGCYGSEIETPNIDSLATNGLRFAQFKNTGRSCPSRASLLTGRYQHTVGMGWMTAVDEHRPGYRGQIAADVPTLPEILRTTGYHTYMVGKWHLTVDGAFDAPNGSYPTQRGFDRYYGCLSGGGSYWTPKPVYDDLKPVKDFPKGYYYTTAISDSATAFINRHPEGEPMFMYVAYYAPHQPLQAPEERIQKCMNRYQCGFDQLRRKRFEKQKQLGLVPQNMDLPNYEYEFNGNKPSWESLTEAQRTQWTREMATYAAMIEIMDDGIGQIVETLRQKGMLENTVFLFLSDNGGTSEGGLIAQLRADLCNTPYRSYKRWVFQGGTSSPLILSYGDASKNLRPGKISKQITHITDIVPTCMDLGQTPYPKHFKHPDLPGRSILPALQQQTIKERDLFFEHESSCAIISDGWKLVRYNKESPWQLIHLDNDPYELHNVATQYPDKRKSLERKWNKWAKHNHVLPLEFLTWPEHIKKYKDLYPDQRGEIQTDYIR